MEAKKKRTANQKKKAIVSVLLMVAILITGAFAFLSAQDSKTNVFTVGNVKVKLSERFDTNLDGEIQDPDEIYDSSDVTEVRIDRDKSILPGQKIIKSPYVENTGKNEAWTYVVVGIPTTNSDTVFRDDSGNTAIVGQDVSIKITAYAIQDKYKDKTTSEDVWNAYFTDKEVSTFGTLETSAENLSARVPLFTVLNDSDFDSTESIVDNSCNSEWTMLTHNIDGKKAQVYRSSDGYDYYIFGYNTKLAAPADGEDSVKTTPVFKGVKLQKDIGEARPQKLNYYKAEQLGDTAAGETDLSATGGIPEGYTLIKTEYYMPGSKVATLYYDETLAKTGYSFDWSIMDDNGNATTDYAYSGMSIEKDTNLLAVYKDTVAINEDVPTPTPTVTYTPSGYLTYSIEKDDNGDMYANLIGANRNAADYPTAPTEVIVPNFVKVINNNGEMALTEGYVGHSYVDVNDIPAGGVSIPVKRIQLAEWQWDSSTNDYAADEAVALGQIAKKLNIAGTNIESIRFCGDIYQHNITSGFVLEDIGTIPFSCTELDDKAFYSCVNLKSCKFPQSLISIGNYAFVGCKWLYNIELANGVASIGDYAFAKTNLKNITIPTGVTSIGNNAFYACSVLKSITIPDSVTNIGKYAFANTQLKNITIPTGITSISNGTFFECFSLEDITIPNSVTSIGDYAFKGCSGLTDIIIPNSVTSIGKSAFFQCVSLKSITIPDGITSIGYKTFAACYCLTGITIPDSVTEIGEEAFGWCRDLTSITIPDSVTSIGGSAFFNCANLTNITISDGVTSIGDYAFKGCSGLTSITIPKSIEKIGNGVFSNCDILSNIIVDKNNTVYDSRNNCNAIIETATNTLIQGCNNDTTIIPNDITSIGDYAFSELFNIEPQDKSIIIPDSVKTIGDYAFYGCTYLRNITMSKNVTSIGDYAFAKTNLKNITIPTGITSIGDYTFYDCCFENISIPDTVISIGDNAFGSCIFLTQVTIPNGTTTIANGAFKKCSNLISVTIPDTVTTIANNAFDECTKLSNITVSTNSKTFASKDGLLYTKDFSELLLYPNGNKTENLVLPEGLKNIPSGAFKTNNYIRTITIPSSVEKISGTIVHPNKIEKIIVDDKNPMYDSRDNCNAIIETATNTLIQGCQNSTIPDGVTKIGNGAFSYCLKLKEITIPDSVTVIGAGAFEYCKNLNSINLSKVTSIGRYAFSSSGLKTVSFGGQLINIDDYAFYGCAVTDIIIPDSVTNIGKGAFYYCTNLISVAIGNNVTSVKDETFAGCTNLTNITIPKSVTSIEAGAFNICYSLNTITYRGTVSDWAKVDCPPGSFASGLTITCTDGTARTR